MKSRSRTLATAAALALCLALALAGCSPAASSGSDAGSSEVGTSTGVAVNETIVSFRHSLKYDLPVTEIIGGHDIDGDGTDDDVTVTIDTDAVTIEIENTSRWKMISDTTFNGYSIRYLCTSDGHPLIYVTARGDNADGIYALVAWQHGGFDTVAEADDIPDKYCAGHRYIGKVRTFGEGVSVSYEPMTITAGTVRATFSYVWNDDDGVFELDSDSTRVHKTSAGHSDEWLTIRRDVTLPDGTEVAAGDEVRVYKMRFSDDTLEFMLQTRNGTLGWIDALTEDDELADVTLFKETSLAG